MALSYVPSSSLSASSSTESYSHSTSTPRATSSSAEGNSYRTPSPPVPHMRYFLREQWAPPLSHDLLIPTFSREDGTDSPRDSRQIMLYPRLTSLKLPLLPISSATETASSSSSSPILLQSNVVHCIVECPSLDTSFDLSDGEEEEPEQQQDQYVFRKPHANNYPNAFLFPTNECHGTLQESPVVPRLSYRLSSQSFVGSEW